MRKTLFSDFELQNSGQMPAVYFFKDSDKCSRNLDKWLPPIMEEGATSKTVRRPPALNFSRVVGNSLSLIAEQHDEMPGHSNSSCSPGRRRYPIQLEQLPSPTCWVTTWKLSEAGWIDCCRSLPRTNSILRTGRIAVIEIRSESSVID